MYFVRSISVTFAAALACGALAACEVGPNFHAPHPALPGSFGELANPAGFDPATQKSKAVSGAVIADWWRTLHDDTLNGLIQDALAGNLDLQIATDRIREARAQRGIAAADLFPEVDATGGYEHAHGSKNVILPLGASGAPGGAGSSSSGTSSPAGRSGPVQRLQPSQQSSGGSAGSSGAASGGGSAAGADRGSNPFANPLTPFGEGGLPGKTTDLFQTGFDASWEIDVFGGNARRVEAANADLAAALENRRDVMVTLLAEVARNYIELRGAQARLAVAQANLKADQELLDLTRSMQRSGLATDLDVARAAGQVAQTATALPPLQTQIRESIHAIAILLGRQPEALSAALENPQPLPTLPAEIPVGLPSELLLRRPDIRRANLQLAAATARVGAATADLFPKFGLTGSVGFDATEFTHLFDWQSHYFLVNPTVTWPVFDAGRIVSNISLQNATADEMLLQYKKTVLAALQDVQDALVAYAAEQARHQAAQEWLNQSQTALTLAENRYRNGLSTYLDVLDAQRTLFSAQDTLTQSTQAMTINLIALYKALGGGWQTEESQAPAASGPPAP